MRTIDRLGLNHALMQQFRKAAIAATLEMRGRGQASLDLHRARVRLSGLRAAEQDHGSLEPFYFVLKQALQRHIARVEAIRQSKRAAMSHPRHLKPPSKSSSKSKTPFVYP
jgi:hypothetical protein